MEPRPRLPFERERTSSRFSHGVERDSCQCSCNVLLFHCDKVARDARTPITTTAMPPLPIACGADARSCQEAAFTQTCGASATTTHARLGTALCIRVRGRSRGCPCIGDDNSRGGEHHRASDRRRSDVPADAGRVRQVHGSEWAPAHRTNQLYLY